MGLRHNGHKPPKISFLVTWLMCHQSCQLLTDIVRVSYYSSVTKRLTVRTGYFCPVTCVCSVCNQKNDRYNGLRRTWTIIDVKPVSNCFRVVVCLNSSFRKIQLACSEVSILLLEINLLLKFDFLLKYEAYPIIWTSDTWCFAGLYLLCGILQRLRWSTAVCCRWRNLKPVHVIRKSLWKTQSVMIGKIVTF